MTGHRRYEERKEKQIEYEDKLKFYKRLGTISGIVLVASIVITLKVFGVI